MPIKVNGSIIPDTAIAFELGRLIRFYSQHLNEAEIRNQLPVLRKKARTQAVGAKLLLDEARKLDIKPEGSRVDAKHKEMVRSVGGEEAFRKVLAEQKLDEEAVRVSLEEGCKVDMLIERVTQGISQPTEAEIDRHFREHAEEYQKPERVQAQHILIQMESDSTPADREAAKSRLMEIRHRLREGSDFADQAAAHSDCPSGRKTGGSLGWFSRGMMIPEFDQAVFSMEVGQLSGIIETPLGYHLVKKTGHEDAEPGDLEDHREKIREFLRHVRRGEALTAFVEELKGKAVVEDDGV
jgi:parvulin-like peptidyl-prolyl isomerase